MSGSVEDYLQGLNAGRLIGQTVGEIIDAYRPCGALPSHADPSWQRLVTEIVPADGGGVSLLFYRDIEIQEDDTSEGPYPVGLNVRASGRVGAARLIDGQVDGFAYSDGDAPALTAAQFFQALTEHIMECGLLEERALEVTVVL